MRQPLIKVCGITNIDDARLCTELGAQLIGLIFVPGSPRSVKLRQAEQIAATLRGECAIVGVFQNASKETIERTRKRVGLDIIQFHGEEPAELISHFRPNIRSTTGAKPPIPAAAFDMLLVDKPKHQPDGQRVFVHPQLDAPYLYAGGLNPANISAVVRELKDDPFFRGVDVASGVEAAPGIKDKALLEQFFANVQEEIKHAVAR